MVAVSGLQNTPPDEKELLMQILNMAKDAGFKFRNMIDDYDYFSITSFNSDTGRLVIVLRNEERHQIVYDSIYLLFFDTTFARALFGESWEEYLIGLSRSANKMQYIQNHAFTN